MSVLTRIAAGSTGGIVGSVLMAGPFVAAHQLGITGKPPPERVTKSLLHRFGIRADKRTEDEITVAAHLGFGVAGGAIYGAFAPSVESAARAAMLGATYGTGVWAVSYAGWVPALGIMPPPQDDQPERQVITLVNHWIYGVVVALAVRAVDDRRRDARAAAGSPHVTAVPE